MTRTELAEMLHGREYGDEITREECRQAKESGLVVIYGASDDLMEFDGAWRDEFDCYDGGTAYVNAKGLFVSECEDESCPYALKEMEKCKIIEAVWCDSDGPTWTYKTDIPHATYDIVEDGGIYCRGIVININDV